VNLLISDMGKTKCIAAGGPAALLRRTDPSVTFEEVCDSLTVSDYGDMQIVEPEADDPEA
jgi:hypothetical protein